MLLGRTLTTCVSAGPFGERDEQQLFVQKVVPETDLLFIRLSSTGQRCSSFSITSRQVINCNLHSADRRLANAVNHVSICIVTHFNLTLLYTILLYYVNNIIVFQERYSFKVEMLTKL